MRSICPLALTLALALSAVAHAAPPTAPQAVGMIANSADSLTIGWQAPATGEATGYVVYAGEKADGPFAKIAAHLYDRTAVVANLKPDSAAYYKVAATNADGEGPPSKPVTAFTIRPAAATPFPAKVATNMCLTLGQPITCDSKPVKGKLESLVDGSDATGCRLKDTCEIKLKLDPAIKIDDAEYLLVHFRTDCGPYDFANDMFARVLKAYTVLESLDSTDGVDGTWTEVASGTNTFLDGVIVIPNHKPKWVAVRNVGKRDLILCRLDVFRSAPAGLRNDYWIFTGDSLVVQDLPGGAIEGRTAWFSDVVRAKHPDRYPIVVHHARGGEMLKDTLPRMKAALLTLCPPNPGKTPTGTIVCWETGFNDVGLGGGVHQGPRIVQSLTDAQDLSATHGLIFVPVRIEFATAYLDPKTLEAAKPGVFHNTLGANLGGVDVFARAKAPYAVDPATQLPFADYWTYTRANHATAIGKDGVHHTRAGSDGINKLWADVAGRMVYGK